MKRTATTLALLAGLGGGCLSPDGKARPQKDQAPPSTGHFGRATQAKEMPGVTGPTGEPISFGARGATPADAPVGTATLGGPQVQQAGLLAKSGECKDCAHVPSLAGRVHASSHSESHGGGSALYGMSAGPVNPPGILPVPGMGPPGAVAAVGAINPTMMQPPTQQRSSVKFVGPAGMRISWQLPNGTFGEEANALTAPASYNFTQGQVYRLRLSSLLPNYPGKVFYPTLEVVAANPKTVKFLAHSSVPVGFTNEDFDQAVAGNMVVKVIYLPDREFADFATLAGAEEIVSTRLDPGADPIAEAQRRGSILAILTLGNIDLENRFSPAMNQPSAYGPMPGGFLPPGMVPPGMVPPGAVPPGVAPAAPPVPMKTTSINNEPPISKDETPGRPASLPAFK